MRLIIDTPDEEYKTLSELSEKEKINELSFYEKIIAKGIPYEEKSHIEFTDLEQNVIADAINYLLGAELLEENGYTEEVINALKSVLQKLGAEEDHL